MEKKFFNCALNNFKSAYLSRAGYQLYIQFSKLNGGTFVNVTKVNFKKAIKGLNPMSAYVRGFTIDGVTKIWIQDIL